MKGGLLFRLSGRKEPYLNLIGLVVSVSFSDMSHEDFKRLIEGNSDQKLLSTSTKLATERAEMEELINSYVRLMCPFFVPRVVLDYLDSLQELVNDEMERRALSPEPRALHTYSPMLAHA